MTQQEGQIKNKATNNMTCSRGSQRTHNRKNGREEHKMQNVTSEWTLKPREHCLHFKARVTRSSIIIKESH